MTRRLSPIPFVFLILLQACQSIPQPTGDHPGSRGTEGSSTNLTAIRAMNDLGVRYLREGHYDSAFIQFQKVLAINPRYARTHFNLGLIYYRKGLYALEIEAYQKAIQIDPQYFHAHLNLAHAYLAGGQSQDATREYQWVLREDPKNLKALYNLAVIMMDQNNVAEATQLFKRYLILDTKGPWADKARRYLKEQLKGG